MLDAVRTRIAGLLPDRFRTAARAIAPRFPGFEMKSLLEPDSREKSLTVSHPNRTVRHVRSESYAFVQAVLSALGRETDTGRRFDDISSLTPFLKTLAFDLDRVIGVMESVGQPGPKNNYYRSALGRGNFLQVLLELQFSRQQAFENNFQNNTSPASKLNLLYNYHLLSRFLNAIQEQVEALPPYTDKKDIVRALADLRDAVAQHSYAIMSKKDEPDARIIDVSREPGQ